MEETKESCCISDKKVIFGQSWVNQSNYCSHKNTEEQVIEEEQEKPSKKKSYKKKCETIDCNNNA